MPVTASLLPLWVAYQLEGERVHQPPFERHAPLLGLQVTAAQPVPVPLPPVGFVGLIRV